MRLGGVPWFMLRGAACSSDDLSTAARTRLHALTVWHQTHDVQLVIRVFGLSRPTLYRWRRRYDPRALRS